MEINDVVGVLVEQNKSFKDMLQFAVLSIISILVIFLTANYFTMRKVRADEIEKIEMQVLQSIKENSLPNLNQKLDDELRSLVNNKFFSIESQVSELEIEFKTTIGELINQVNYQANKTVGLAGDIKKMRGDIEFNKEV
jgi:hypothetical protein